MKTEWFMLMAMGYSANVRAAVTVRITEDQAVASIEDMLRHDPDAERAHVLRAQVAETGLRTWKPVTTIRRARNGEMLEQGPLT